MNMAILSKEQILAAQDLETEEVSVPAWGGSVLVRSLTARERGQLMASIVDQKNNGRTLKLVEVQVRTCAMAIVDANGVRMFGEEDIAKLARKSSGALQLVFEVAQRLSGMSDEQVEELVEDFDETPSEE
jgi:hypothetical protein